MMQELIWYATKEVKRGICCDCFTHHTPNMFRNEYEAAKSYIEQYKQFECPPAFNCMDCGRIVYYLPPSEDRPGWWIEKDITDNFKGVIL